MATVTLNLPDTDLQQRIADAAYYLNWQEYITDEDPESLTYGEEIPNPESSIDRIKREVKRHLKALFEAGAAKRTDAARLEAIANAQTWTENITIE